MTLAQLQREGPRLIAMHSNLIQPGAALWKKAQAERRFKKRHFFALESEKLWVAGLCVWWACGNNQMQCFVFGKSRRKPIVAKRHIAMCVAYELSGLSTIALGKLFNRGHDMILHAQRRVNTSKDLRDQADRVSRAVKKELRKK